VGHPQPRQHLAHLLPFLQFPRLLTGYLRVLAPALPRMLPLLTGSTSLGQLPLPAHHLIQLLHQLRMEDHNYQECILQ